MCVDLLHENRVGTARDRSGSFSFQKVFSMADDQIEGVLATLLAQRLAAGSSANRDGDDCLRLLRAIRAPIARARTASAGVSNSILSYPMHFGR
jgi:hypothetical protein